MGVGWMSGQPIVVHRSANCEMIEALPRVVRKIETEQVMHQIVNDSAAQALLGYFKEAMDEAVMESGEVH